jgi:hypothetical protein
VILCHLYPPTITVIQSHWSCTFTCVRQCLACQIPCDSEHLTTDFRLTTAIPCHHRSNIHPNIVPGPKQTRLEKGPDVKNESYWLLVLARSFAVIHVDVVRICLRTAAINGPIVHPPRDVRVWSSGGMIQGGTEELGEKHVPVSLCLRQILYDLNWARTRTSEVRGRRLSEPWYGQTSTFPMNYLNYRIESSLTNSIMCDQYWRPNLSVKCGVTGRVQAPYSSLSIAFHSFP